MSSKNKKSYFFHDKPLFGLDIGFSTIKVMQASHNQKGWAIDAYGVGEFPAETIKDGVIVDLETMAKAAKATFEKNIIGSVTTRRVAVALPAARTFTRPMSLPKLAPKDLAAAVQLEAEQYIPVALENLYMDFIVTGQTKDTTELLAVAIPKPIVDSYTAFLNIIGLEPVLFETTIASATRLFEKSEHTDIPTVLIDFGSLSTDITVYDKQLIVTGTASGGGDVFTDIISNKLNVSPHEAHVIKTKYGLDKSKKQQDIMNALEPTLNELIKELRRLIRYYEERAATTDRKIGQVITMGGGANMPGLNEYLTSMLRLPVHASNPWRNLTFGGLQPPPALEKSLYVTVAGLALIQPKEIFA